MSVACRACHSRAWQRAMRAAGLIFKVVCGLLQAVRTHEAVLVAVAAASGVELDLHAACMSGGLGNALGSPWLSGTPPGAAAAVLSMHLRRETQPKRLHHKAKARGRMEPRSTATAARAAIWQGRQASGARGAQRWSHAHRPVGRRTHQGCRPRQRTQPASSDCCAQQDGRRAGQLACSRHVVVRCPCPARWVQQGGARQDQAVAMPVTSRGGGDGQRGARCQRKAPPTGTGPRRRLLRSHLDAAKCS